MIPRNITQSICKPNPNPKPKKMQRLFGVQHSTSAVFVLIGLLLLTSVWNSERKSIGIR